MVAPLLFSQGCTKDSGMVPEGGGTAVRITASGDAGTRVALDGDGMTVRWTTADRLGVFMKCPGNTIQSDDYDIVPDSFGGDDNSAEFSGSLEWGDASGDYTFYGYNPLQRDLQADPHNIMVTLPFDRVKQGSSTLHYSNGYFAVAEPSVVSSNGTRGGQADVPLRFHHLFPLVELRFAALNTSDMVIERVTLRSENALSVEDGLLDITKNASDAGFAVLSGGSRRKSVKLTIGNAPAVPVTGDPGFTTAGSVATPDNVFAARINILPGNHALCIIAKTNYGTFRFSRPARDFVRARRYATTLVLDPSTKSASTWDGNSEIPDYQNNTIHIANAQQFCWLIRVMNSKERPYSLDGYSVFLDTDIDMDYTETEFTPILRKCNFDGQGHTVYNVNVRKSGVNGGFFSDINDSRLSNLHIEGCVAVTGGNSSSAGGIAAVVNTGSEVSGCTFSGLVGYEGTGGRVGGLFGYVTGSTVQNCGNYAYVRTPGAGNSVYIGGLAGHAENSPVSGSFNKGGISGGSYIGGLFGFFAGSSITACANYGEIVVPTSAVAGGVVGSLPYSASVTACYNRGALSGGNNVGGVIGSMGWSIPITACYNTVPANRGLYGGPRNGCTINACYISVGTAPSDPTQGVAFSETDWPEAGSHAAWGVGNSDGSGPGHYWKDLGGWNGGDLQYPSLWWE